MTDDRHHRTELLHVRLQAHNALSLEEARGRPTLHEHLDRAGFRLHEHRVEAHGTMHDHLITVRRMMMTTTMPTSASSLLLHNLRRRPLFVKKGN